MVKHPWPPLEISLSDFHRLATLNINTYLPTYLKQGTRNGISSNAISFIDQTIHSRERKLFGR